MPLFVLAALRVRIADAGDVSVEIRVAVHVSPSIRQASVRIYEGNIWIMVQLTSEDPISEVN